MNELVSIFTKGRMKRGFQQLQNLWSNLKESLVESLIAPMPEDRLIGVTPPLIDKMGVAFDLEGERWVWLSVIVSKLVPRILF